MAHKAYNEERCSSILSNAPLHCSAPILERPGLINFLKNNFENSQRRFHRLSLANMQRAGSEDTCGSPPNPVDESRTDDHLPSSGKSCRIQARSQEFRSAVRSKGYPPSP